jgi:hypothetical protein
VAAQIEFKHPKNKLGSSRPVRSKNGKPNSRGRWDPFASNQIPMENGLPIEGKLQRHGQCGSTPAANLLTFGVSFQETAGRLPACSIPRRRASVIVYTPFQ